MNLTLTPKATIHPHPNAAIPNDAAENEADIAAGISEWLLANQQPEGRILDPLHSECGTYAAGLAALTFDMKAAATSERRWIDARDRAVRAARSRPLHSEFDQFGLLLLKTLSPDCGSGKASPSVPDLYNGARLVSNNWIAMRALNYSLRSHLTGSVTDARIAESLWRRVLAWQTCDGLFIDSPRGDATPITYHAKFCAMLALLLALPARDAVTSLATELQQSLERGLQALSRLISPSGVLVPYGRSRNTLFGQAAAILALRVGAALFETPQYTRQASRLEARLRTFQNADGHIPCVLNDGEAEKRDWDVYVNNPDYNAYAAALLLAADLLGDNRSTSPAEQDGSIGDGVERAGPFLVVRANESYAAFVVEGQCAPFGTPFFCDHRYYGMQPLWAEAHGAGLLTSSPYRWRGGEDRSALTQPAAIGGIPWVEHDGLQWCARVFGGASVIHEGDQVRLTAEGTLEALTPVPRWERGIRSVAAKLTNRVPPVFRRRVLRGARLQRVLTWDTARLALTIDIRLVGALPPNARFHDAPASHPACA